MTRLPTANISAFFAERYLQAFPETMKVKNVECIVYPSVAWEHIPTNIAVLPDTLKSKFALAKAREYLVLETWYDRKIQLWEYPVKLQLIRESKEIKNGRIIWKDD